MAKGSVASVSGQNNSNNPSPATVGGSVGTAAGAGNIGEGLAAARALYATTTSPDPATTSVPFLQPTIDTHGFSKPIYTPVLVSESSPNADLKTILDAEVEQPSNGAAAAAAAGGESEGVWVQCFDEESGWPYVYNEITGEVKWVEPESTDQFLAELWDVCYDQDGNEFYYNAVRTPTFFLILFQFYMNYIFVIFQFYFKSNFVLFRPLVCLAGSFLSMLN